MSEFRGTVKEPVTAWGKILDQITGVKVESPNPLAPSGTGYAVSWMSVDDKLIFRLYGSSELDILGQMRAMAMAMKDAFDKLPKND